MPKRVAVLLVLILAVSANVLQAKTTQPAERVPPATTEPATSQPAEARLIDVPLPAHVDSSAVGAGGKLLFLQMKALQQLVVYDIARQSIIKTLSTKTDKFVFAAGKTKLFIGLTEDDQIQRWDLATLKLEATVAAPEGGVCAMAIGPNSIGPLLVIGEKRYSQLNPDTLKATDCPSKNWGTDGSASGPTNVHVSFDGTMAVASGGGWAGIELDQLLNGAVTTAQAGGYVHGDCRISGDARLVFTGEEGIRKRDLETEVKGIKGEVFAADDPLLSLAFDHRKPGQLTLLTNTDPRPLCVLENLPEVTEERDVPIAERVHLIPSAGVLITISNADLQLVVRKFDRGASMEGKNLLFVSSMPETFAQLGKAYVYDMKVISSAGGVEMELHSGPPGMTLSDDGVLKWIVPGDFKESTVSVSIKVTDASTQMIYHEFVLNVGNEPPVVAVNTPEPGEPGNAGRAGNLPRVGPRKYESAGDFPGAAAIAKADKNHIALPAGEYRYVSGLGGHALLLAGNELAILSADGFTIEKKLKLPRAYVSIAERKNYYVAISAKPCSVDVIDKATLKILRKREVGYSGFIDLAANPTLPVSYISYVEPGDFPAHHFLIFDETTGDAHTDNNWIGQWLAVSQDGAFLITGFQESYQKGNDIIDNPDRIWIVPTYGYIDIMARYDLDLPTGLPISVAHRDKMGGNGTGIRLSDDGRRAAYPSYTGFPAGSKNGGGWDPLDLSKLPVNYACSDVRASPADLAFHPLLSIVACPGKSTVVCFDRETGDRQEDRVDTKLLAGQVVSRVYFSPDGKSILAEMGSPKGRFLVRLPLKLNAGEQKKVSALPRSDPSVKPAQPPANLPTNKKLPEVQASVDLPKPRAG